MPAQHMMAICEGLHFTVSTFGQIFSDTDLPGCSVSNTALKSLPAASQIHNFSADQRAQCYAKSRRKTECTSFIPVCMLGMNRNSFSFCSCSEYLSHSAGFITRKSSSACPIMNRSASLTRRASSSYIQVQTSPLAHLFLKVENFTKYTFRTFKETKAAILYQIIKINSSLIKIMNIYSTAHTVSSSSCSSP